MGWKAQRPSQSARSRNLFNPRGIESRNLPALVGEAFGRRVTVYGAWALLTSPSAARGSASHSELPRPENQSTFGFLKNWKPDLFCINIAPEKVCEFWIANRSRVKIFLTKSFQGRLPRTYYTPPACALHNKLSLTWKEPPEPGAGVFGALGAGH